MSSFQMTPISILDKSPMGGFRGGMADTRSLMHSDSALNTEALTQQGLADKNQEFKDNTPLRMAERALKLAESEKLQSEMDQGLWEKDRQRKRDMEMADLEKKLDDNQMKKLETRIKGAEALQGVFGEDVNPGTMATNWESARQVAKEYKFDIGDYNPQNAQKVMAIMKATPQAQKVYMDNVNHRQAVALEGVKGQNRVNEQWLQDQEAFRRTKYSSDAMLQATRIREANDGSGGGTKTKIGGTLERIREKVAAGKQLEPGEIALYDEFLTIKTDDEPMVVLAKIGLQAKQEAYAKSPTPQAKQEMEAAVEKVARAKESARGEMGTLLNKAKQGGSAPAKEGMGGGTAALFNKGGTVTAPVSGDRLDKLKSKYGV